MGRITLYLVDFDDATFFKIREIAFSYTLPKDLASKIRQENWWFLQSDKMFSSGQNSSSIPI